MQKLLYTICLFLNFYRVYHQYDDVNWFILVGPDVNIDFNKLNSFLSGYKVHLIFNNNSYHHY